MRYFESIHLLGRTVVINDECYKDDAPEVENKQGHIRAIRDNGDSISYLIEVDGRLISLSREGFKFARNLPSPQAVVISKKNGGGK